MTTALKLPCDSCGNELDEEERENPRLDEHSGKPICDNCYHEHHEGTCDRCRQIVESKELEMRPGELLAFWEETDGLMPGYYRVLRWPIYMDGMITGYVLTDNLKYAAPLDEKGKQAAEEAYTPGGRLCEACRTEVEKSL